MNEELYKKIIARAYDEKRKKETLEKVKRKNLKDYVEKLVKENDEI